MKVSTSTTIKAIGSGLAVLALTTVAVVGLGATTDTTPIAGGALPVSMQEVATTELTPQGPALSVAGMPKDMVAELVEEMDFTADAAVLADVTTIYGPDQIDVENMDDWQVGFFLGMGYRGYPNDGVDRLYAPGTRSI